MPYLCDQRFHLLAIIFAQTHRVPAGTTLSESNVSFFLHLEGIYASFRVIQPRPQNLSDFGILVPAIDRESTSGSANEAQRFAAEITFSASSNNRIARSERLGWHGSQRTFSAASKLSAAC